MTSPSLAIQGAIVTQLRADVALDGLIADRVYDRIPAGAAFPYVTIGESQEIGNFADCYDGSETFQDVHVWSRSVGMPETKNIASAIRASLHEASLSLDGHTLELIQFRDLRILRDPDGITTHGVLTFRILSQPAES